MKLLALLLLLVSCSTQVQVPTSQDKPNYLSSGQIYAIYDTFTTTHKAKSLQEDPLSKEDKERLSNLIPNDQLYSPEFRHHKSIQPKSTQEADYSVRKEGVDLRSFTTSVKSQDNGKCTAYAGVGAMETKINQFKQVPNLDLSEWDAWSKYGVYSCDSFIRALSQSKNKICDEQYYPQYKSRSSKCEQTKYAVISNYRYLGSNTAEIIRSLNDGNPVYIGMSTPNDMVRCRPVINPANGFARGGHALLILGYLSKTDCAKLGTCPSETLLIVKNSWGSSCADKGYHYMPLSILSRSGHNSAYWEIKEVNTNGEVNPNPLPLPEDPNCLEWRRIWYLPWKFKCVKWK